MLPFVWSVEKIQKVKIQKSHGQKTEEWWFYQNLSNSNKLVDY